VHASDKVKRELNLMDVGQMVSQKYHVHGFVQTVIIWNASTKPGIMERIPELPPKTKQKRENIEIS
jgi:hypothetical protein